MTGEICLRYKDNKKKEKQFKIKIKELGSLGMIRGLMFRSKKFPNALLFDFPGNRKWKIHSLFVFFKFIAVYLDDNNKVLDVKKVRPFKFLVIPSRKYKKLVEIPPSNENFDEISKLVDK